MAFSVERGEIRRNMVLRKRPEDNPQEKKVLWYLGLLVAVFFLLWILFAPGRGYFQYRKLQREISALTQENSQLEAKNAELSKDIKRLQSDDTYLEEVARKKHGLLKKNETVYEFEAPKKKK
jgi:cell division protein FtsB